MPSVFIAKDTLLLPAVSGLLLFLSIGLFATWLPPLPLAFVAFVPLLAFLERAPSLRRALLGTLVFGAVCYIPACTWLFPLKAYTSLWWFIYLYCAVNSIFFPLIYGAVSWALRRYTGLPFIVFFPALYVLLEQVRNRTDLAFPVDHLACSLTAFPSLIQFAEWTGAFGITLWILAVGCLLFDGIHRLGAGRRRGGLVLLGGTLALFLAGPVSGWFLLQRSTPTGPFLRVAMVQPDLTQERKKAWNDPSDPLGAARARAADLARLVALARRAVEPETDLLIFPETSRPGGLYHAPGLLEDQARIRTALWAREHHRVNRLLKADGRPADPLGRIVPPPPEAGPADPFFQALAVEAGVPILFGAELIMARGRQLAPLEDFDLYNAAILARPDRDVVAWSAKVRLVPFAEGLPLLRHFGIESPTRSSRMRNVVLSLGGGFTAGEPRLLETGKGRCGVLVCYEGLFPYLSREYRNAGADFLVTITNDRWFGNSAFPAWLARSLVLRAIETRLPMARAANSGVSCLVDARGRMHHSTGVLSGAQVIRGSLLPDSRDTFYVRHGDWPLFLASVLVVFSVVVAVLRRKRTR